MNKKGITRRQVILGSAIAGVAGASAIVHVLRGRYEVSMPDGALAGGTVGGRGTVNYLGQEIAIEIPPMVLRTPEDRKKLQAIIDEQVSNNPKVVEAKKMRFEKWKEENLKRRLTELDELEGQQLERVANATLEEQEKKAFVEQIKKGTIANKEKAKKRMDELGIND